LLGHADRLAFELLAVRPGRRDDPNPGGLAEDLSDEDVPAR
jgi:hypothetical protein